MKKLLLSILLAVMLVIPTSLNTYAETYVPTRVINLVYDDSGSMIRTDGAYVDTWCQAKYAMEVFAAMLGEKDTLNIYYMSDYVSDTTAPPKVSLTGSKNADVTLQNVKTIHDLVTDCSDTPFNAVKKAHEDLVTMTADEKWLVVLTDGEFNNTENSTVENYYHECVANSDLNIMMLSMGPKAAMITPDEDNGIFFEKAENTTDILGKLTSICNRIFQSNALPINESELSTSFSVPMSQLIVFAQGKDVSIGSISSASGEEFAPNANVKVCYSSVATTDTNYPQESVIVADDLMGYVAVYDASFGPGEYTFNVSGAEDIQVYYKPNVSIAAYLYDGDKEVTAEENLSAGKYRLEFGFVNAETGEKITDTSLLGNIEFESSIVNQIHDGTEVPIEGTSGDQITIEQGELKIDVTACFLEYNVVNTQLSYSIYSHNDLIFEFQDKPSYMLTTEGFENPDEPMILTVMLNDGKETRALSAEQWELLGIPSITTEEDMGEFRIEQTDEIGVYHVYPTLKEGDPMQTATGSVKVKVSGGFTQGMSAAEGEAEDSFSIKTDIEMLDRIMDWLEENWLKLVISLTIFFILLGYIPPFKKYLPRKMKKRPLIECRSNKVGLKDMESHGKYKRNLASTLIPYKAETGFVTFSPSPHKKTAKLKAAGGNGIYIMNTKAFAGKSEFAFNGMQMEENRTKPLRIGGGSTISLNTAEYMYTCYLNR